MKVDTRRVGIQFNEKQNEKAVARLRPFAVCLLSSATPPPGELPEKSLLMNSFFFRCIFWKTLRSPPKIHSLVHRSIAFI